MSRIDILLSCALLFALSLPRNRSGTGPELVPEPVAQGTDSLRQYCPDLYLGANSPGDTVVVIPYRYKLSAGQSIYMRAVQCGFGKVREVSKVPGVKWSSSDTSVAKVSRTTGRVTITKDSVRLRNGANVVIKAVYP